MGAEGEAEGEWARGSESTEVCECDNGVTLPSLGGGRGGGGGWGRGGREGGEMEGHGERGVGEERQPKRGGGESWLQEEKKTNRNVTEREKEGGDVGEQGTRVVGGVAVETERQRERERGREWRRGKEGEREKINHNIL